MDPLILGGLALLAIAASRKGSSTTGAGFRLTPGNYLLRFKSAKPQTNDLNTIWSMPQMLMSGTGASVRFDSLQVDRADPSIWWFTALMTYGGTPKDIQLLPDMTLTPI